MKPNNTHKNRRDKIYEYVVFNNEIKAIDPSANTTQTEGAYK